MSLRELQYLEDYRSGYDDIMDDFLRPSLRESKAYWRAVGYFSSSALEMFGKPLGEFVRNGGVIRLVTSVELSERDLKAIESGASKQEVCEQRIQEIIEEQFTDDVGDGVARLCALLAIGRLEIRIAVPKNGTGIYHEKIGLFFDADSDQFVAFSGSANESRNAFDNNRECIDVYPLWESPSRALRKKSHFEQLWNFEDKGVDVYNFSEAARKRLLRVCEEYDAKHTATRKTSNKWRHQEEALAKFLNAERGVLNMATGTGKTRTALEIFATLYEKGEIDTAIIAMDGTDLLDQWFRELLTLRSRLQNRIRVFRDYEGHKELQNFLLSPKNAVFLVTRRAGATRDPLVSALRSQSAVSPRRVLLIHDEVHRLGSANNRSRLATLSGPIRFRLGLSATPEREYDAEGNAFIEEHIGPELMRFELADAIRRGILAPFNYFPLPFEPSQEDRAKVRDIYRRQSARAAAGEPMTNEQLWTEIALVYKTSPTKLPLFAEFIDQNLSLLERCIIFVETKEYGDEVLDIIHRHLSDFHTYFTGEQSETLKRFARGDLECLVTCHRVSEGIDIRSLNSVILFSSARARLETIQRMGRCLRADPNNPHKIANVVDFIRQGDGGNDPTSDEDRCAWLTELSTVRMEGEVDGT